MNEAMKDVIWVGDSREQVRSFPKAVKRAVGEDVEFEQSCGNVFKDLGFSDAEAERNLLKADLAFEIYNILDGRKLTRARAGEILGVHPSDVSRLKKGDFNRFSVDACLRFSIVSTVTSRFGLRRRKMRWGTSGLLRYKVF